MQRGNKCRCFLLRGFFSLSQIHLLFCSEEPETTAAVPSSDSESSDSAEEFDENLDILKVPVSSSQRKQQKRSSRRKRTKQTAGSDSDDTEASDSDTQRRRKRIRKKTSVHIWTEDEDARLKELYSTYAGSRSVFDIISQ